MKAFWKSMGWFGLAVTGLLASLVLQVIMGVVGMVGVMLISALTGDMSSAEELMDVAMDGAVWGVLFYHLLSLPVFGLWYYFGCGRRKPVSPGKVFDGKSILGILIFVFGLSFLANGMVVALEFATPGFYQNYVELMESAGMGVDVRSIIASVLLAPIGEELLCRGIIFYYCGKAVAGVKNRTVAFWIANALQALLFGIMHGNVIQGSYAFVLGMGLGWLRYHYQSLYPSMLCHFLFNFMGTFVMGFLLVDSLECVPGAVILIAVGVVVTAIGVLPMRRKAGTQEEKENL